MLLIEPHSHFNHLFAFVSQVLYSTLPCVHPEQSHGTGWLMNDSLDSPFCPTMSTRLSFRTRECLQPRQTRTRTQLFKQRWFPSDPKSLFWIENGKARKRSHSNTWLPPQEPNLLRPEPCRQTKSHIQSITSSNTTRASRILNPLRLLAVAPSVFKVSIGCLSTLEHLPSTPGS